MCSFKFSKIAARLDLELNGVDRTVNGINEPDKATVHEVIFLFNKKAIKSRAQSGSKAWIIDRSLYSDEVKLLLSSLEISYCLSENVYDDFVSAVQLFYPAEKSSRRIHPTACIQRSARIGQKVRIMEFCSVGKNVSVGKNTVLYPHVTIYDNCEIGENVIIHSGTVIGCDGFGFYKKKGSNLKIPHIGKVVIEDHVEIGANCCIDRGTLGETRIRKGSKLDNLIQVAHNVDIGENTLIAAQAGIAGSTTIGNSVTIGGQVGIVGHIKIGNGVTIAAQSGVISSIDEGKTISGYPARDHGESLRKQAYVNKIPGILAALKEVKK
jgi:UDP-3-O-[3-hydroxymyristoyl] glucosamine N-acyltransferase